MSDLEERLKTLRQINPKKVREMSGDNKNSELQNKIVPNQTNSDNTNKDINNISTRLKEHEIDAKDNMNKLHESIADLNTECNNLKISVNKFNIGFKLLIIILIMMFICNMVQWATIFKLENRVLRLEDTYKYHMVVDEGKNLEDLPIQ